MQALYLWLAIWFKRQEGQDLIEYAVIIALVLVAAVVGLTTMGGSIATLWNTISTWVAGIAAP